MDAKPSDQTLQDEVASQTESVLQAVTTAGQYLQRAATAALDASDAATPAGDPVPRDGGWVTPAGCQLQINGGTDGTDYSFADGILHILSSKPLTVKMADGVTTTAQTIQIDAGVHADLTLAGVTIQSTTSAPINMVNNVKDIADNDGKAPENQRKAATADEIRRKTMLHLTLASGTSNTLESTVSANSGWPGIRCGWGSVLVIDDEVRNLDTSNNIVTPVNGLIGSDVTLIGGQKLSAGSAPTEMDAKNPGELTAVGRGQSAGIGGGPKENSGTIIINGGRITATSTSSNLSYSNGAGIGGGAGGSGTVITINGGRIKATAGYCGSGIGSGLGYFTTSSNMDCTAKEDAIDILKKEENSHGYSFIDTVTTEFNTGDVQYPNLENYHTVAGDITLNSGFVDAHNGGHGNAFGQSCGHGPASNKNHIIRVTGGTLLATVTYGSGPPRLLEIGARLGYTIITGGSVRVSNVNMFQGFGDTAYNTQGVETWDDVVRIAGGDPNDPVAADRKYLPDTDKVQMLTIDLSSEFDKGATDADKTVPVTKWKLEIDNIKQEYGAPSYLDKGKLYLWLPESATGKNVTVTMSYRDKNGVEHDIEPMYVEEVGGDQGSTLKRYIDIQVEKLSAEQQKYFSGLEKEYDGLSFEPLTITADKPIEFESEQGNKYTLTDSDEVTTSYQPYDSVGGSPLPGSSVTSGKTMPADTGTFRVQLVSKEYTTNPTFANNYWGHRITAWAQIKPVPAVLKIAEKDGTAWVRLKKQADGSYDYELVKETDKDPGTHLRVAFTVRSAKGTAVTCKAPTGKFQVLIDGKPVGEPVPLTEEAMEKAPGSSLTIKEGAKEKDENTSAAIAGEANRWETQVEYFLDPTNLDGALDVLGTSGQGNTHEVTVRYIPDKNYVEGTEESPEDERTEASKPTTIVPVKPEGTVAPDDPDKVEIEDSPKPEPGPGGTDPDNPTGKMQVVRKTINVSYGDFHRADAEVDDFFKMAITSNSSAPGGFTTSNTAVADLVRGEDGAPVLDEDGKLQIQVNSCGTSVITLEQKANALFTGIKYILTVNVTPDPSLKPQIQIRLTWRNLTALGETSPEPAAALAARGLAALASGEAEALAASTRAVPDRASTPPRPGDVIEYTVTGLNLTPGSAWQAAELKDAIDARLSFDAKSVEIASNYATHSDRYDLGTAAFYSGFNWDGLGWTDVEPSDFSYVAPTLTKGIGTVYGGQSTSVRFRAKVMENEGLGDRPEGGKLPEITNEPGGSGGYGKDEDDLAPGEDPVPPEALVPDADIVVVGAGDKDPETGKFPPDDPTPVLPKDPPAADIQTTVKVELKEHTEEHDGDRFMVGDTLQVTVTSTNTAPDSKLADAVIKATLPEGMEPVPGTIRLVDAEGNVHEVPDSAYDPKTGTVAVNAGDLYGGESARLVFDVEVTSTSETRDPSDPSNPGRPEGPGVEGGTLGTTPTDEWDRDHPMVPDPDDPDGPLVPGTPDEPYAKPKPGTPFVPTAPWPELEDELVSTPPAVDPDMPPVLPSNPKLEDDADGPADVKVSKTAENLDRDDGTTRVGDTVRYTVTLANSKPHSMWYGAVVRDEIPKGLEPLAGTIRLTAPDGSEREVPDAAYDPATRVLAVTAGDLAGGRTAVLTFECEVTEEAVGADTGNVASAHGTRPSDIDPSEVAPGATRPAPGEPFSPSGGWDAFLEGHPGVDNADAPAYAPGTDAKGGVVPADPSDDDGSDSGKTRIRLAQTGDALLAAAVPLALAALAAGAVLIALVARRRRWTRDGTSRW
ncbi:MAG: DUF11 domain-containing protein [Adlercreutzia mucosicola]|nr:DUF11 domain-containing protein [Adlercreutzia mucosicola]